MLLNMLVAVLDFSYVTLLLLLFLLKVLRAS